MRSIDTQRPGNHERRGAQPVVRVVAVSCALARRWHASAVAMRANLNSDIGLRRHLMKSSRLVFLVVSMSVAALFFTHLYVQNRRDGIAAAKAGADPGDSRAPIETDASGSRLHQRADEYARAYDLTPLRSGSKRNELRLWFIEPIEGGIAATVFAEDGALSCEGKSNPGEGPATASGRGQCRTLMVDSSRLDLDSRLHAFRALAHGNSSCNDIADGWGMMADGVVDGERFVFEAWNPDGCDNADAKKLHGLLEELDQLIKR